MQKPHLTEYPTRAIVRGWGRLDGFHSVMKLVTRQDGSRILTETKREWFYYPLTDNLLDNHGYYVWVTQFWNFDGVSSFTDFVRGVASDIAYESVCHCIQCDQLGGDCSNRPSYEEWRDDETGNYPFAGDTDEPDEMVRPPWVEYEDEELPF